MNRKDTILVAVLVNVGVLLILFISSLKPHSQQEWQAMQIADVKEESSEKIARVENNKSEAKSEAIPKEFMQAIDQFLKSDDSKTADVEKETTKSDPTLVALEVKSGDVLGKIAKSNGSSVEEIKKINSLHDDKLQAGQTLYVPQNSQPKVAQNIQQQVKNNIPEDRYYTVKNGDNPWTIATKNHIKVEELLKLNGLDDAKAKKIKPGDRLRIK